MFLYGFFKSKFTYFAFMLKYIKGLKAEFAMASQKKARKTCCVYL